MKIETPDINPIIQISYIPQITWWLISNKEESDEQKAIYKQEMNLNFTEQFGGQTLW